MRWRALFHPGVVADGDVELGLVTGVPRLFLFAEPTLMKRSSTMRRASWSAYRSGRSGRKWFRQDSETRNRGVEGLQVEMQIAVGEL